MASVTAHQRFLVLVFFLPILLGLPFVGRAFFVDDFYHVTMAQGLLEHPTRPYDFRADDAGPDHLGWERGQPPRMVNPPLHHYLLALFLKIGGGRVWVLRLLSLGVAGASAVCLTLLAARLYAPPGPITVLCVLTPVFWLSSYALLIDSPLQFFFLAGLWTWMEGVCRRSGPWFVVSGLLMGLTLLTKYTGALLLPVAVFFWWIDPRSSRRWRDWLTFLIPGALFGLWTWWNMETYGASHFTESSKRVMQSFAWSHLLTFATFFSGVFILPLEGWSAAVLGRKGWGLSLLLALGVGLAFASPWGGFPLLQSLMIAGLALGTVFFLAGSLRTLKNSRRSTDRFLWAWLALGIFQMVWVMQWVAARYFLTLLLPVTLLLWRQWEGRFESSPQGLSRRWTTWAVGMGVFSLCLALGDYLQADVTRRITRDLARDGFPGASHRGFVLSDTFRGHDLKEAGWASLFADTPLQKGDRLLRHEVIMPPWWFHPHGLRLTVLARYEYPSRWPFRVMDNQHSAGFYASAWGALPFTLTRGPLERYTLYEVE